MFAFMAVYHLQSSGIALRIGFSSIPNNSPVIFKGQRHKKTISDTLPAVIFVLAFFLEANLFPAGKNSMSAPQVRQIVLGWLKFSSFPPGRRPYPFSEL
jgi:hypothetical protein